MYSTDDLIQKELSRIESKKKNELSKKINEDYIFFRNQFEKDVNERTTKFNKEIDEKISRINEKNKMMKKIIFFIVIVVLSWGIYTLFLKNNDDVKKIEYSLTTTKISDILGDPRTYQDKSVSVSGKVMSSFSLGFKYYLLKDETGEIYIIPKGAVPKEGELVKATGIFKQKLKIGKRQISVIEEK